MREKKLISMFLSIILILIPVTGMAAEKDNPEAEGLSGVLMEEACHLTTLEAGRDYEEGEGVFLADTREEAYETALSYGGKLISFDHGVGVVSFGKRRLSSVLRKAASDRNIKALIEPNYIFRLLDEEEVAPTTPAEDPYIKKDSIGYQYAHEMIGDQKAHKICSGNGVRVAVVDTGVNPEHEDLIGKVSVNYISGLSDVEAARGIDSHGHGTHVAGVIGAIKDNGLGGYGVAPAVSIDSIQITVTGKGFKLSSVLAGLRMAIELGDDVISLSIGSTSRSLELREILNDAASKGIVVVAAAGNDGNGLNIRNYPAAEPGVIAVGAVTSEGELADYSDYGSWIDLAAPGTGIVSTYIYKPESKNYISGTNATDSYGKLKGTSQAVPYVSGTAALLYSVNSELRENRNPDTALLIREAITGLTDGKKYSCKTVFNEDRSVTGLLQTDRSVSFINDLKPSKTLTLVDTAGHHSSLLTGQVCRGKSIKLKIGDKGGTPDKKLLKEAVWETSDPELMTVKKGKIKAGKKAEPGKTCLITATVGEEKLYFVAEVKDKVEKFAYLAKDSNVMKTTCILEKKTGETLNISDPCTALGSYTVYNACSFKKYNIESSLLDHSTYADARYRYKISISKKDLQKMTVNKTDDNGDPLEVTLNAPGTVKVKYKLLDGSKKSFTLKINTT